MTIPLAEEGETPKRYLPPNERLIQDAEQQEQRFCSLMLKDRDCVKQAIDAGIQSDWFWTESCAEMYFACARYFKENGSLVGYTTYEAMLGKVSKAPEEVTRKVRVWQETWALPVKVDDFAFLKSQIVSRHAQRCAGEVLEKYYNRIMTATNGTVLWVEEFREAVAALPVARNGSRLQRLDEFNLGDDHGGNLLGDRLLCRGDDMLIASHAGAGKSVFIMQLAMCLAVGDDFLGIKPVKPLGVLVVQAENSEGDLAEHRDNLLRFLGWSAEKGKAAAKNIRIVSDPGICGDVVPGWIDSLLSEWKADLVIIDPLFGFLGGDVCDQAAISRFIRNGLKPLWRKHACGHIMVHHTNKPVSGKGKPLEGLDLLYAYSGSAELANSYRCGAVIHRTNAVDRSYAFFIPKRGTRSGLLDGDGQRTDKVQCRWSTRGGWGWEAVPTSATMTATTAEKEARKPEDIPQLEATDILSFLPADRTFSAKMFIALAQERLKIGRNKAENWLEVLLHDKKIVADGETETKGRPATLYRIAKIDEGGLW